MTIRHLFLASIASAALSACATDSQNLYSEADVGKQTIVEFGVIVAERPVTIQGKDSGLGASTGMVAGTAIGAQAGNGNGQLADAIAGLVVGTIVGAVAEHELQKRDGIEYTITENNAKTVTVVQNIAQDDKPLAVGARVIVQTQGDYMRVLPAADMPAAIKRPQKIEVKN